MNLPDPVTGSGERNSLSLLLGWLSDQTAAERERTSVYGQEAAGAQDTKWSREH